MTIPVADEARGGGWLRDLLVATFARVMRLYFRDIERLGDPPGPEVRGRVFVANHTNALIDPVLVITDAACPIAPVAKSTLWAVPGLRWLLDRAGAVPIVRRVDTPDKSAAANADAFRDIAAHLSGGGNILIFPEGTSHSEPHLAPLRTGAARMVLAASARGATAPTFQAVALEFDAPSDFRSRCLVLWGPVRQLSDVRTRARARGDAAPRADDEALVQAITAQMAADLGELLVEGETHDERRRVARVAELLANDAGERSLGAWSGIGRQVELASQTLRGLDADLVARVAERVDAYYAELERLGLRDGQIGGPARFLDAPRAPAAPLAAWQRAALAPLAAAGFVLYAVPYFLPRWIARRADPDAVSTIKLGAALVVYPVWAAGLVTAALVWLPAPWSILGAAVALTSPFAALRWLDAWYQRTPEPTPDDLDRLGRLRTAACAAIDEARRRLPT